MREKGQHHDFLHEIITHYKNNQVNAWFMRKMSAKRDVTYCWFNQKSSNAQLNNLEQHSPFTCRSEQKNIDGINDCICCLVDEEGLPYGKVTAVTNHQMHRLPTSLINSL